MDVSSIPRPKNIRHTIALSLTNLIQNMASTTLFKYQAGARNSRNSHLLKCREGKTIDLAAKNQLKILRAPTY